MEFLLLLLLMVVLRMRFMYVLLNNNLKIDPPFKELEQKAGRRNDHVFHSTACRVIVSWCTHRAWTHTDPKRIVALMTTTAIQRRKKHLTNGLRFITLLAFKRKTFSALFEEYNISMTATVKYIITTTTTWVSIAVQ